MSQIAFGTIKFLFWAFLNSIYVLDFMSECAQHLDQKEQKKVLFCQNCMISAFPTQKFYIAKELKTIL